MPDPSPPALAASAYVFPDGMLHDLLAVSLTAVNLLRPLYGPDGSELVDFAVEYLNPAAQRITGLPEQPHVSVRARFPDIFTNGVFDFYRRVFETGEPGRYDFNYQADGFDNYFHVAARRSGDRLLVSFTDTADQPRTPVELALRTSQAREQQALAQVEAQHAHLQQVLLHLPAQIATYRGPDHVYDFVNACYTQPLPRRHYLGRPIREVLPEVAAQGILAAFDRVYSTGEPHHLPEQELWLDLQGTGQPEQLYLDFYLHPLRDAEGRIYGLLDFTYNVTAQVRARQQVETLNQELETRVAERTAALQAATREQLQEREQFYQIFAHTPAAICIQRGAEHRYEYVNAAYQAFFPDRQLLGRPVAEALPEIVPAGILALLDGVYQTGETYFGHEVPLLMAQPGGRPPQHMYFTFTYQAYRENGEIVGISTFAYDVSAQVLAREHQRQQLRELFAQAPVAIAVFRGPRYVIELANPAVCAMWGRTAEQTLGTPLFELLPEAAGQGFEELLDGVLATGVPHVAHELPSVIERGGHRETVYWNFVYQPLREAGDPITAITVVATDVTELVQARQRAEASELQVRSFIEAAPFPIGVFVGPDLRVEFVNQALLHGWGKGPDVIGKRFVDVLPELKNQSVFGQLQQVYATGVPFHTRNQRLEAVIDGQPQTVYYNYSFIPLRDAAGRVYGVMNTAADVTDVAEARHRVEQFAAELQESEQRFRIMADAAPNLVWAVHPDSSIRYINRAFIDFVGVDFEVYQTTGWSPYMHAEEMARVQQVLTDAIAQRRVYSLEHRMLRHDGQFRWLLAQGAPSYYPNGDLYGYVGSAIDITELKQTNEQLTRTNIDLDNFIYTASHDLKQPIANIEGLLNALREQLPAEAHQVPLVPRMLAMMQESVERFQRTIHQLTNLTRLQQAHDARPEAVDLAAAAAAVCLDLADQLREAQLTVDVSPGLCVHFSPQNLRSVIYNLLSNALKYRHPHRPPVVHLRAYPADHTAVLEVQDNGLGLNGTQQGQLFGLFKRLHAHVEGTGIGLYTVKRMVENVGGTIAVHSLPGLGSTFTVTFPA
ncbi:MAG: hypothetical protein JWR44_1378 [Hymenobacter sp.]|jgi:PAS domain S-box-containing protein|nr:hypothetical protein [Hymenobacter sp.]